MKKLHEIKCSVANLRTVWSDYLSDSKYYLPRYFYYTLDMTRYMNDDKLNKILVQVWEIEEFNDNGYGI